MAQFKGDEKAKQLELKRLFSMRQQCVKLGLFDSADLYSREYQNLRDLNLIGQPESAEFRK